MSVTDVPVLASTVRPDASSQDGAGRADVGPVAVVVPVYRVLERARTAASASPTG